MLFEASRLTGDPRFRDCRRRPCQHASSQPFPRGQGSAYHIVVYDSATGRVREHRGGQGLFFDFGVGPRSELGPLRLYDVLPRDGRCALSGPCREERGVYSQPSESPQGRGSVLGFRPSGRRARRLGGRCHRLGAARISEYVPHEQSRRYVRAARGFCEPLFGPLPERRGLCARVPCSRTAWDTNPGSQVDVPIIYADSLFSRSAASLPTTRLTFKRYAYE